MRVFHPKAFNPGDKTRIEREPKIPNLSFKKHKFNRRPRPSPNNTIIIGCFSEFGCETIGVMYCIPRIISENPGKYYIVAGWHGRSYLYKHLVDEFWEIDEEFQCLREYARAFHHESANLKKFEEQMKAQGKVIDSNEVGHYCVGTKCQTCGGFWGCLEEITECKFCKSKDIIPSLFDDVANWKKRIVRVPRPSMEKLKEVDKYIQPNSVGVYARNIKRYGRNLQIEYYVNLIKMLQEKNYNVVWLGEKESVYPCPDIPGVVDIVSSPISRDLEMNLAIISRLKFTVQYWTASTRLAAMVDTPYILFESPDQLWGEGQEGFRRELTTFSPYKIAACHFLNVYNNNAKGLEVTKRCIEEIEQNNYDDVLDLLEDKSVVQNLRKGWLDDRCISDNKKSL